MKIEIKDEAKKGICFLVTDGNPYLDIFLKPFVFGNVTEAVLKAVESKAHNALITKEKPSPKLYLCRASVRGSQHTETIVAYSREVACNTAWENIRKVHRVNDRDRVNLTCAQLDIPKGYKLVGEFEE